MIISNFTQGMCNEFRMYENTTLDIFQECYYLPIILELHNTIIIIIMPTEG